MTAARSAAQRVREYVRIVGTGRESLDHDLMLLANEVMASSKPHCGRVYQTRGGAWVDCVRTDSHHRDDCRSIWREMEQ